MIAKISSVKIGGHTVKNFLLLGLSLAHGSFWFTLENLEHSNKITSLFFLEDGFLLISQFWVLGIVVIYHRSNNNETPS